MNKPNVSAKPVTNGFAKITYKDTSAINRNKMVGKTKRQIQRSLEHIRNKERDKRNTAIYYKKNKKKLIAYSKKWVKENPEKVRISEKRSRQRQRERMKKDPVYAERIRETARNWIKKNRKKINDRRKERIRTDPKFRKRLLAYARENLNERICSEQNYWVYFYNSVTLKLLIKFPSKFGKLISFL